MAEPPEGSQIVLTDKLRRWIRTVLTHTNVPNDLREELRKYGTTRRNTDDKKSRTIPFQVVKAIYKHVEPGQEGVYLHELLEGSDIHIPEPEPTERNPELEARIQSLKNRQANKEYAEMTRNVDPRRAPRDGGSIGKEIKAVNSQLIAVFNTVLTVICSFVFVYKALEYSMEKPNFHVQLICGMIVATIVFFADLYFLLKNTI